jgi:hypothetical protein
MTRQETTDRFNNLPREMRTTLIGIELSNEIDFLKREKNILIDSHNLTIKKINERIKNLELALFKLKDD